MRLVCRSPLPGLMSKVSCPSHGDGVLARANAPSFSTSENVCLVPAFQRTSECSRPSPGQRVGVWMLTHLSSEAGVLMRLWECVCVYKVVCVWVCVCVCLWGCIKPLLEPPVCLQHMLFSLNLWIVRLAMNQAAGNQKHTFNTQSSLCLCIDSLSVSFTLFLLVPSVSVRNGLMQAHTRGHCCPRWFLHASHSLWPSNAPLSVSGSRWPDRDLRSVSTTYAETIGLIYK